MRASALGRVVVRVDVVDEEEIEVGAVADLATPELAHPDDREMAIELRALSVGRLGLEPARSRMAKRQA